MALPGDIRRRMAKYPPTTVEHRKILRDFESEYDRAIADGDFDEARRLLMAFEQAWRQRKAFEKLLGFSDPFDVST